MRRCQGSYELMGFGTGTGEWFGFLRSRFQKGTRIVPCTLPISQTTGEVQIPCDISRKPRRDLQCHPQLSIAEAITDHPLGYQSALNSYILFMRGLVEEILKKGKAREFLKM
ncbi:predicted protein [Histoplasma capsulatum G186AR]|uniref:Uncharacterized protein n=2 Tax=Ajellomyces capsulatus TaxID=5037 RepID=C0NW68_AJECG|nr:uncharacterized protein HCBG_07398 [Histoplasma capsulatum G186AR]EEH04173.1 predicted protein [Histoplasma capsulatum G186AR]KAG5291122.1 hypothetical protein I7I52_08352 [Histoplasma capsulatum]QSS68425.1 hypothetical protein I7I50_07836 [Histoplasma capsulatum G186AR]